MKKDVLLTTRKEDPIPVFLSKKFLLNYLDLFLSLALAVGGIYIFYPGAMSGDSVGQWWQVLNPERIGTWYPPSMVYLWIALDKITHGPQGMLIFHFVIYNLSIYILANIFYNKLICRICYIIIFCLFPPIFFLNGVIWKDVSMLVSIAMSLALLLKFESNGKKLLLILSVCFLLFGAAVRHNAIVCVIPYVIYTLWILIKAENRKKIVLIVLLTPVLFFASIKLTHFANHHFVKEGNVAYQMENSAFIWDLWGMSVEIEQNIIPRYVFNKHGKKLTIDQLKKYYLPYTASVLWIPYLSPVRWQKSFPDKRFKKDFINLIIEHPAAYFTVRSRIVQYMLGLKKPIIVAHLFNIYKPDKEGHWLYAASRDLGFVNKDALYSAKKIAYYLLTKTPLYLVWIYFVLIFLQFVFIFLYKAALGKYFSQYLLILSTGLIYWLPYTIISASADFRYSNLTIFSSIIMFPLLIRSMYIFHKSKDDNFKIV